MQALGHYFDECVYYYQAIEKFQEGLSIDRTCYRHWHAIGWTYSRLGDLENNPETLELSLRFFQKAIDLHSSTYYIFDYASSLSKLGEMTHEQHWLEEAVVQFERLLNLQKNAIYLHPDWLFQYACTLDALGDFFEEEFYYLRAIEIFSHVLMIDPDFTAVHHRQALALSHLGELTSEVDHFYRAVHHFRLAMKNDEENDMVILDWATTLINIAGHTHDSSESDQFYQDAEHKLQQALRLGNLQTYYYLACLYSLLGECEKGMFCLEKARIYDALPATDEILQDEWLDNLRSTADFQEFLTQLDHRRNFQEEC
jgi:tetratricopeptide (TPR) repeat protein